MKITKSHYYPLKDLLAQVFLIWPSIFPHHVPWVYPTLPIYTWDTGGDRHVGVPTHAHTSGTSIWAI